MDQCARMSHLLARLLFYPEDEGLKTLIPACGMAWTYCSNDLDKQLHLPIVTGNPP